MPARTTIGTGFLPTLLLCLAAHAAAADPFLEQGGLVVMETESAPLAGSWSKQTAVSGWTGTGYYEWRTGNGSTGIDAAGSGILAYDVRIATAGRYRFQLHSAAPAGADHNDVWARFPTSGARKVKSGVDAALGTGWFKVYQNRGGDIWNWGGATVDHDPHAIYADLTAGDHRLELSGRSTRFKVDRIVLYHSSVSAATAQNLATAESARGSGGGTNAAPTVSLTAPAANATFTAPATIALTASASDSDGTVTKVEFFQGATKLGEDTTAGDGWKHTWNSVPAGTYSLTARATDDDGATKTSTAITVTVTGSTPTNTAPTVSLTAPAANAAFTAPASIALTASASDSDGTVTKVEFFQGATKLGEDTTAGDGWKHTWSAVAAGTYSLTARATDDDGATRTSTAVTITVRTVPPAVAGGAYGASAGGSSSRSCGLGGGLALVLAAVLFGRTRRR